MPNPKRSDYQKQQKLQQYQDDYGKELAIRKRIARDFNKRVDDFATELEYNNYLEEIEGIIYNLMHGIDVEETNRVIQRNKQENQDLIRINQAKKQEQDRLAAEQIAAKERERRARLQAFRLKDLEEEEEQLRARKEALKRIQVERMRESMGGNFDPDGKKKLKKMEKETALKEKEEARIKMEKEKELQQQALQEHLRRQQILREVLPAPPTFSMVAPEDREKDPVACARAGGYSISVCQKRTLEEMHQSLFIF